jgi:hypothetical protein
VSEIMDLVERHRFSLVSGVPDYYKIRQIEKEIYDEPITEYPGEWDDTTKEDHWSFRHYRYGTSGHPQCMWCEDVRRKSEITLAKVRAEIRTEQDAMAPRRRRLHIPGPILVMIIGWVFMMGLITVGVLWG